MIADRNSLGRRGRALVVFKINAVSKDLVGIDEDRRAEAVGANFVVGIAGVGVVRMLKPVADEIDQTTARLPHAKQSVADNLFALVRENRVVDYSAHDSAGNPRGDQQTTRRG